jgi:hypothetical protein
MSRFDLDISDQTVIDDFRKARVKAYAKMGKSIYEQGSPAILRSPIGNPY